jgi:plasmid stability protein
LLSHENGFGAGRRPIATDANEEISMSQLLVRDLEDELVVELKRRAAENGRSAEAEHREILRAHLLRNQPKKRSFKEVLAAMPDFDDDELFDVR